MKSPRFAWPCMALSFILFHCSREEKKPLLELLSPESTGITFANQLTEDENLNIISFEYFYNGAGVGIGDINNDGLKDIFFSANMSSNRLYVNKGNFTFEDITERAGLAAKGKWASGVSMVDINQDGLLDIYVCYAGPFADPKQRANELYINNGDNTFTDKAHAYGLDDTGHSVQASFFDYDRDGDLDVYVLTNITDETGPNVIRPKRVNGEMVNTDRLYRNNGDQTFTNVSREAGITIEGYGLGVSIADITRDGWPDIYVSNDYLSNDLLYINNRDGTFTDHAAEYFRHTSYSAMGNDVSDFNNDGLLDVVAVDMLPPDNKRQKMMFGAVNYDRYRSELQVGYAPQFMRNTLQLNTGMNEQRQPTFSEIGQLAGIHATDWSWSPLFADIDNDGWKDLLVTNGYPRDITNRDFVSYRMQEFMQSGDHLSKHKKFLEALRSIDGAYLPGFVFRNNGDLTFTDRSAMWGFTTPAYSTGAAYADLDNDGDLDYVTNNINGPASVFKNHTSEHTANHFLRISFSGPAGNLQGYGAKAIVYVGNDTLQYFEHFPSRGYQSTVEQELHAGLGHRTVIDSLRIEWPDGKQQVLHNVKADQVLTVKYADATEGLFDDMVKQDATPSLFIDAGKERGIEYVHSETEYADFKIQPLLPHKCSQEGPGIAVADVNGDGLEDLFVGGGFKQSGKFFLQGPDGRFQPKALTGDVKYEEDLGVLLFDADGDRDNDLYIASGGNEFASGSSYYEDRLYINDGKGNFKRDPEALPTTNGSGSCVVAADYDRDGDLDLFVGGRLAPQHYPQAGTSYLLQNDRGRFSDVTERVAPGLRNAGMVTSALWTDVDNDDQPDLMIAGEWMPVTLYKNKDGMFQRMEIANSAGWWNSVAGADFDADGDTDYVLGNLGVNSKYTTSAGNPLRLYLADFNRDGIEDPVLAHYIQGVNRPAHPRDDMLHQMVSFKKRFPSYQAYSDVTMDGFVAEMNVKPVMYEASTFRTSYLENKGKDGWVLTPLPVEAQFAPVYGIVTGDYDHNGYTDIMLTGNSYAPDVLTGRYDALKGLVLAGDGSGKFKPLHLRQSGVSIDGDAKALAELVTPGGHVLVIATQNNDTLRVGESRQSARFVITKADDYYMIMVHANGRKERRELYYGAGYLSQSSRRIIVSPDVREVIIYNKHGARTAAVQ